MSNPSPSSTLVVVASELLQALPPEELPSGAEVLRLVHGVDPINQIKDALIARGQANNPVEVLRIISPGEPGSILMAGHRITAATVSARTSDLNAWSAGLAQGADILLYGSSIAARPDGVALVNGLASATGRDVAASSNASGAGGDAPLEIRSGNVSATPLADREAWQRSGVRLNLNTTQEKGNQAAFAALRSDGSIKAWGNQTLGGSGAPTDAGYTQIFSTNGAFAALKSDGSINAWGSPSSGGSGAPTDAGYTQIFSTNGAFAALKSDGSINAWGSPSTGGSGAPTDAGYTQIFSTNGAFAALKSDGSIKAWGSQVHGGLGAPTDAGYTQIFSATNAFAALKSDGSIKAWGNQTFGGAGAPTDAGYTQIFSTSGAFAALKSDGSIKAWGTPSSGGSGAPTDAGYTQIFSTSGAFAALKSDGSIRAWGNQTLGGSGAPTDAGYTQIFSTGGAFAALKSDGSINAWGSPSTGGSGAPTDAGYIQIFSTGGAFAALKSDGSIKAWGSPFSGGSDAPTDAGYIQIFSTGGAFAALKSDGSIKAWGSPSKGGSGAPTDDGYASIQTTSYFAPLQSHGPKATITSSLSRVGVSQTALITVQLSATSTDFSAGDLTVTNGSLSEFQAVAGSNGQQYTAIFTPTANTKAEALITVAAGSFSEAANSTKINTLPTSFTLPVDTTPPSLLSLALANNAQELMLVFSQPLANGQTSNLALPPLSAFALRADGHPVAISSLAISGASLSLSLAAPIAESVKQLSLTYTDPSGNNDPAALQDLAGQDAATFTGVLANQAPVLALDNGKSALSWLEGAPSALRVITSTTALQITDSDSTAFSKAAVSISSGFTAGDQLTVDSANTPIKSTYDAATGQLTLFGQATASQYQQVLSTLSFSHSGQAPTSLSDKRALAISLSDTGGSGLAAQTSSPVLVSFGVQGVNSAAPVLNPTVINATASLKLGSPAPTDGGVPSGAIRVRDLVSTGQGGNVTDGDADPTGVAIVATTNDATAWFSTDGGAKWTQVGAVSKQSARVLYADDTTWIYLQPKAGVEGTITEALTFRAWDRNSALAGTTVSNGQAGVNTTPNTTGRNLFSLFDAATNTTRWFEYVASNDITWDNARSQAATRTLGTSQGFLATFASQAEVDAVKGKFSGNAWIGASDAATEGDWKWITGPEAGTLFWRGAANGTPQNNEFNNWNRGLFVSEPNNSNNEDYAQLIGSSGKWRDSNNGANGYLVEFPPITGEPALLPFSTAFDSLSLSVEANQRPVLVRTSAELLPVPAAGSLPTKGSIGSSTLVRDLISSQQTQAQASDPDSGDQLGIAITAIAQGLDLHYSTDAGATWRKAAAPSESAALVLRGDDNTRIQLLDPGQKNASQSLTNALTFKAWDGTGGFVNGQRGVNTTGAPMPFNLVGRTLFSYTDPTSQITRWFEYVEDPVTWDDARLKAAGRTLGPLQGHLATFTSQAEVDAVKNRFGNKNAWIGASDEASEGDWKWVTGLEAGTSFWSGAANGLLASNQFANWNSGEPNNRNDEDYALFNGSTGRWNDSSATATANGYLVEYSQEFNDPRSPFSSTTANASLEIQKFNQAPGSALPGGGKILLDLGNNTIDATRSVVTQSDGKILIAGYTSAQPVGSNGKSYNYGLVRLKADGTLDSSFGIDGKVLLDLGTNTNDYASSVVTQSDGKILIAGNTDATPAGSTGSSNNYSVVRLNADGTLDSGFGIDGKALIVLRTNTNSAESVVTQSDGKILIAGTTNANPDGTQGDFNYGVLRLNADGTLDSGFGIDGMALLDLGTNTHDNASSLVMQSDGKILIAGTTNANPDGTQGDFNYGVVRLKADGTLDNSFGIGGKALLKLGAWTFDAAYSVVTQDDGKILIAGKTKAQASGNTGNSFNYGVVRLKADGTLDSGFGSGGKVLLDLGTNTEDTAYSVVTQTDGKILIAGYTYAQPAGSTGRSSNYGVVRLNANGTLDNSFGIGGKVLMDLGTNTEDIAYSVVMQNDGKILIAGDTKAQPEGSTGTQYNYGVVRLNADGTLDTSFGTPSLDFKATYSLGQSAVKLDDEVLFTDPDLAELNNASGNYAGARLVLQRDGAADSNDQFSGLDNLQLENPAGSEPGRVVLGSITNTSSPLHIGSWTQANGKLEVLFNNNATQAAVNEAASSIGYRFTGHTPPASPIKIRWTFSDGNGSSQGLGGELSTTGTTQVTITPPPADRTSSATLVSNASLAVPTTAISAATATTVLELRLTDNDANADGVADGGTSDGKPTEVRSISLALKASSGSALAYQLRGPDLAAPVAGKLSGDGTSLEFDLTATPISIANNSFETYSIEAWYASGSAVDGAALVSLTLNPLQQISLGTEGSQFNSNSQLLSRQLTSSVSATTFKILAPAQVVSGKANTFTVQAVDANGNLDKDATGTVSLQLASGAGRFEQPGSTSLPTANLLNGVATFTGLIYRASADGESFALQATGSGNAANLTSATSAAISADVVATRLELQGQPSTTTFQSSQASSLTGLSVAAVDADGSIDRQWLSGSGIQIVDLGNNTFDIASSTVTQSDGKILIAGTTTAQPAGSTGTFNNYGVVRLNDDGTLDTGFGSGGKALLDLGANTSDVTYSVVTQSDGKILIAGYTDAQPAGSTGTSRNYGLVRLNADGTLDTGFGSSGKALLDLATNTEDNASSVVIQSDGKILIAGATNAQPAGSTGTSQNFGVVRLNADGTLDNGFGSGGKTLLDLGTNTEDSAYSVVTQSDGKILIAGATNAQPAGSTGFTTNYSVVRLNADGTLDTGFGSGGKTLLDLGTNTQDSAYSVVTQSDGKILIAGHTDAQPAGSTGTSRNYGLVRLNADGTLDTGFGSSGKALLDLATNTVDNAFSVVTQSDGKILIAGSTTAQPAGSSGSRENYGVVRLNANGILDSSFGIGGKVLLDLGANTVDVARSVVTQSDGKILIAGTTTAQPAGSTGFTYNYSVVRLNADGSLDTSFGAPTLLLSLSGAPTQQSLNGSALSGTATELSRAAGDLDSSAITITLDRTAVGSDGRIDLGALQLSYTNNQNSGSDQLVLKAELLGGTPLPVALGHLLNFSTSLSPNTAPSLSLGNGVPAFLEAGGVSNATPGSGAIAVAPNAVLSDLEQANLASLKLAITNLKPGDQLALNNPPSGLSADYDASTGELRIVGTAPVAVYQLALQAVAYSNSSDNPDPSHRTIAITVSDGSPLNSTTAVTQTITVAPVNDAPTLVAPASVAATEDTPAGLNLTALSVGDADAESTALTLRLQVSQGSLKARDGAGVTANRGTSDAELVLQGTASSLNAYLQGNNPVQFIPVVQANGAVALNYSLSDGTATPTTGSTTINVAPVNDAAIFNGVPAAGTVARLRHGVAATLQSLIGSTPISFTDPDLSDYGSTTQLSLSVNNASLGGLSAGAQNGGSTLTINSGTSWLVSGTAAQISALLADPAITLQSAAAGAVSLSLQLNDGSNVAGATTTAGVQFLAVSDPVLNNPASSSARSISAGFGESLGFLSITDPDAGSNPQIFTLTISDPGNTATLSGLTDTDSASSGIQLTGTAAQINSQLADGRYKTSALGSSSLQLSLGNGLAPAITSTATFTASNPLPTLTQINNLTGAKEDQPLAISFSDLSDVADDADKGGSVEGFVVKAVSSGTLKLGTTELNAQAWSAGTNDRITPTLNAYWTPAANATGTGNNAITAFTVTALDNSNGESTTPLAVKVEVSPLNDAPSLSASGTINIGSTSELFNSTPVPVNTLLATNGITVSDLEQNANTLGIAITGTTGQGSWQYATAANPSSNDWTTLKSASTSQALVLAANNWLRYQPGTSGNAAETAQINFSAWDGTDNSAAGSRVDLTAAGGSTAFSTGAVTAALTVVAADNPLQLTLSRTTTTSNNITAAAFTYQELDLDGVPGNDLALLDSQLTLSDPDTAQTRTGVKLLINSGLVANEDRLELQGASTPTGTTTLTSTRSFTVGGTTDTVTAVYVTTTGVLDLTTGTARDQAFWQEVLRSVGYRNTSDNPTTTLNSQPRVVQVEMLADNMFVRRDANGLPHFYEYVSSSGISWTSAEAAARARTYAGMSGYLATITSAEENLFLQTRIPSNGWIGASDAETEGVWKWVAGPESGQIFWNGAANGSSPSGYQAYWAPGEPNNNFNEDYAQILQNGLWNDEDNSPSSQGRPNGYLVEYSSSSVTDVTFAKIFDITIAVGNDAPVLASAAPALSAISEDATLGSGQLVSSFVDVNTITDADSGALRGGVAITSLNSGNGRWEYSLNNAGNWQSMGALSAAASLLLRPEDAVRFVPDAENGTTASFTYRAWDQTTGTAGTRVNTSLTGGSTAFSATTNTASITVSAVNDAPVWNNTTAINLGTVTGADPTNTGVALKALVADGSDPDSGASTAGVAVVGLNDTVNGTDIGNWEVSTNNGSSWTALTGISATTALLLEPGSGATTNLLRFAPSGAVGGTVSLDLRLWDRISGTAGSTVDPGSGGGSSAYSTNSRRITFTSSGITLAGTASSLSLIEGQTLAPGSSLTLSSGTLNSARVLIASGLTSGDELLYSAPSGNPITGSYDASKGELLLSGTASSSDYEAALRAVTFKVGDDPTQFSSKRQIAYLLDNQTSSTAYTTVTVTAAADAPSLSLASSINYQEGGSPVALHPNLSLTDADDLQIDSATVSIDASDRLATDLLRFSGAGGSPITAAAYNSNTGVLSLTGRASLAEYEAALRSITFENTSANPTDNGTKRTRTITMSVTDANSDGLGPANSSPISVTVNVAAINSAPLITAGPVSSVAYNEGGSAVVLDAGITLSDADDTEFTQAGVRVGSGFTAGDLLALGNSAPSTISAQYDSNQGILTLTPTTGSRASLADFQAALRTVTFQSSSDDPTAQTSSRTIAWSITDANSDGGYVSSGRVGYNLTSGTTVTITPAADAPALSGAPNAAPTYTEAGAAAVLAPTLSISDVDDTQLSAATVRISNGLRTGDTLSVTPAANSGITSSYDAVNGVLKLSGTASLALYESTLRTVAFSSTSSDPTGGALTATRSFDWRVTDANSDGAGAAISTVLQSSLTVQSRNDAPEISSPATLSSGYREGDPAVALNPELALSDADSSTFSSATVRITAGRTAGDVLSLSAQTTADTGVQASWDDGTATLTLTPSSDPSAPAPTLLNALRALRAVSYASSSDHPTATSATRTIEWQVSDSAGASSTAAAGTFTITPVNDAPTFSSLSTGVVRTLEDTAAEISFQTLAGVSNASDVDGQVNAFVVKAVTSGSLRLGSTAQNATAWVAGSNDAITGNTKAFWTPAADVNGSGLSAFTVVARDNGANGGLASSTPVAVTVDVTPVADIAQITGFQMPATGTYGPGSVLKFAISLDRAISLDPAGGLPSLSLQLDGNRSVNAVLQNAPTNAITNYAAGDQLTFAYTVVDGDLGSSSGIGLPSSLTLPDGSRLTNIDSGVSVDVNRTLPSASSTGVLVDGVRPVLASIKEAPGSESNRAEQTFRVSFSEPVRNVDATDFRLTATGSASGRVSSVQAVNPVNGVAADYDVTVSDISGLGRLVLELDGSGTGITDSVGNPIAAAKVASGSIEVDRVGAISRVAGDDRLSLAEATNPYGIKVKGTVSQGLANQQLDLLISTTVLATITAQSDGSWSAVVPKTSIDPFVTGNYTLELKQSTTSLGTRAIAIDRDAPTLSNPITDTANNPFFTGGALLNKAEVADGLVLKGTTNAENDQQVDVRLGNINAVGVVTNGSWEVRFTDTQLQRLSDGSLTLALSVSDLAGNRTTADYSVTLDTTALVNLAPISKDGWINIAESSQALTISGVVDGVEDGRTVDITVGSRTTNPTTPYTATIANGAFSTTVAASDLTWVNGASYNVSVSGSDAAGNTFLDSKSVTADLVAPTVDLKLAVGTAAPIAISDAQFNGAINTPNTLNGADFTAGVILTSSASSDASTTNVSINSINQLVQPTTSNGNTSWSVAMDPGRFSLPQEGSVAVSATVTDQAGNTASQSATVTVDRAATVAVSSPVDGGSGNNILNAAEAASVSFSGTTSAVENGASVAVQVVADNSNSAAFTTTATTSGGSWTAAPQNLGSLANGTYSVQTTVTDGAGNTATASQAIQVNTAPPSFTSTAVAGDNRINAAEASAAVAPSLSGLVSNAEDGQQVSVTLPGAGSASGRTLTTSVSGGVWNLALPTDLLSGYSATNGSYTANVTLSNQAGNSASTTATFAVDTAAPVLTFNNPTDAQWGASALNPGANPLTLSGTVQDLENGQAVTVVINGRELEASRDSANPSNWSLNLARQLLQSLRAAGNEIAIKAKDLAGNLVSLANTFNADGVGTTPPQIVGLPLNRTITAKEGDLLISQFKADQAVTWSLLGVDPNQLQINPSTGGFSFVKPISLTDTDPNNLSLDNLNLSFTLVASDSRNNQAREDLTLVVRNLADPSPDLYDQDGIAAALEDVATNGRSNPGDLNNDGIPDRLQPNVAAVPWISKENFQAATADPNAAAPNSFAALQTSPAVRIASVDVRKPEELAVSGNSSAAVPALINGNSVSYPYDPLVFRLESYDAINQQALDNFVDIAPNVPGVQVRQLIDLPGNGLAINTYLKWNPSANNGAGSWYTFLADGDPNTYDNGAEFFDNNGDGLIDQILLTYTDGDPAGGDIDGLVNGIIDDPGMPGLLQAPRPGTGTGTGGGGSSASAPPTSPAPGPVRPGGVPIDPAPAGTNIQPTDADGDGIREVTFAADSYGVDGNRDRVLDADQGQVAGIRLINDGAKYSDYGALVVSGDVALRGVTLLPTTADGSVAVTMADGSTVNAPLPSGITNTFAGSLSFELSGLTPGGTTEALLYLPVGYTGDGSAYVRFNYATGRFEDYRDANGNRLYAFTDTDGDGFGDAITLTLTDGDAQWDGDGLANGSVVDPGFLASGAIEITGDGQNNRLTGNILANQIRGKAKRDLLIGDLGDDILRGGGGNDRLHGGEGADVVIGGGGGDRFLYRSLIESTVERADTIQFNQRDQIDLRRLDANATRKGNQAFRFVADAEFSGKAGELRLFESRLLADVDGDRQADFALNLRSNQAFSADVLLL